MIIGRAAHAHVMGIASGLEKRGAKVRLIAQQGEIAPTRHWRTRITTLVAQMGAAMLALPRSDIVYIRSHPAALPLAVAAFMMRIPVIHEVNGRMEDLGLTYRLHRAVLRGLIGMQRWQYRLAAGFAAVTPGFGEWVMREAGTTAGRKVLAIIPNAADTALFRPGAQGGPELQQPYVIFFGALTAWHGADVMLRALASNDWPAGVALVLIGEGPQSPTVRAAAKRQPRLVVPGSMSPEDIAGTAARALAVLVPITPHGGRGDSGVAPIKLYEGMASGRPVIVSDQPFQRDVVEAANCGIVIPTDDADALAQAVARLHGNAALADTLGRNGRVAAEADGDWQHRAAATADLIGRVLQRRR